MLSKISVDTILEFLYSDSPDYYKLFIAPTVSSGPHNIALKLLFVGLTIFVYIFVVLLLPSLIYHVKGGLKGIYLSSIFNPDIAFKLLPEQKLNNCIYNEEKQNQKNNKETIGLFKQLFIDKKVYVDDIFTDDELSKRVYSFNQEIINSNNHNLILIGDAGCGKSTLLFDLYISIIENQEKVIPVFIDLKDSEELSKSILKQIEDPLKKSKMYQFLINHRELEDDDEYLVKIFTKLAQDGYRLLIILDSLDENKNIHIINQIKHIRASEELSFLIESKIESTILIALRENALSYFLKNVDSNTFHTVYRLREYDYSEVDLYINKLIEHKIITSKVAEEKIRENIELVTYDGSVNPFIVSRITNIYRMASNDFIAKQKNRIVPILFMNVEGLSLGVNIEARGNLNINRNTFRLIAIQSLFTGKNLHLGLNDYINFMPSGITLEKYNNDVSTLQNNTYLVDPNFHFYQKIFADFYSAIYVLETYLFNKDDENYLKIIDELFTFNDSYDEVFEYMALLTDYSLSKEVRKEGRIAYYDDVNDTPLNYLLDYILQKAKLDNTLDEIVFKKVMKMISVLDRYSSIRIRKDAEPILLTASYDADSLIVYLYSKYFTYLLEANKTIDYNRFYYLISKIDKHHLALKAILSLKENDKLFNMLSIIRDSFMFMHYHNQMISLYDIYPNYFSSDEINTLSKLSTKSKDLISMSKRELLNASFYFKDKISYNELNNLYLNDNLFPTIYNLDLFIDGYNKQKDLKLKPVLDEDDLLYSSSQESSVFFVNLDLNNHQISLSSKVLTLCIYSEETDKLTDVIKNTNILKSIDVCNNIKYILKNAFDKSLSLRNIILPNSLVELGDFSLYECHNLSSLNLPLSLEYLGESFVEDCFSLKRLSIPQSVKKMGQFAFENCVSLSEIDFKNNNVALGIGIFTGCQSLSNIDNLNLSNEINVLPKFTFNNCSMLKEADLTKFKKLEIIDNYCFCNNDNLIKVILPSSIKEVNMLAFEKCPSLEMIIFNNVPLKMSAFLFSNLSKPLQIVFNIDKQKSFVIKNKKDYLKMLNIMHIEIKQDKFIEDIAYEYDQTTEGYILDFSFNYLLKKYDSKETKISVKEVAIGAFGNLENLDDVIFDENLLTLGDWAFEDCYSLYTVNLSKTKINMLQAHVFENCSALAQVSLPSSLKIIKEYAFEECLKLNKIIFEGNDYCEIGELIIPNYLEKIETLAFHNCISFNKIIINNNKITIEPFAFSGMDGVSELILPSDLNLSNLSDNAFKGLNNIKNIKGINLTATEKERLGL